MSKTPHRDLTVASGQWAQTPRPGGSGGHGHSPPAGSSLGLMGGDLIWTPCTLRRRREGDAGSARAPSALNHHQVQLLYDAASEGLVLDRRCPSSMMQIAARFGRWLARARCVMSRRTPMPPRALPYAHVCPEWPNTHRYVGSVANGDRPHMAAEASADLRPGKS